MTEQYSRWAAALSVLADRHGVCLRDHDAYVGAFAQGLCAAYGDAIAAGQSAADRNEIPGSVADLDFDAFCLVGAVDSKYVGPVLP